MMRWLRRWLGYEEEPMEEIIGGLTEMEAEMWAEALRNEGIGVALKSASPLMSQAPQASMDLALHVRASDAPRARRVLAPLLKTHGDPSHLPRTFRRGRGRDR
jgi:hypothetical protein